MRPISASSIELWTMCQRRWAFSYLANYSREAGRAAEAGKRVHALLEEARDAEPALVEPWGEYDVSRMARVLWAHNPRDEGAQFEVEWEREIEGLLFKGVIDRLSDEYVLDYKTTGGSLKYAKTPTRLKRDVQRLLYSQAYPDVAKALWITGTWANSEGAKRAGDVVAFDTKVAILARDRIRDNEHFKELVLTPSEQIAHVAPGTEPLSFALPSNAFDQYDSPCQKFPPEKCPHFSTCHKTKRLSLALAPAPPKKEVSMPVIMRAEPVNEVPKFLIENLYVDCLPLFVTDVPVMYSLDVIAKASREVEGDVGLKHVMLADFAKGPHLLAAELCAQLELLAPVKHFYLETKSAEGRGVMQSLMGRSKQIFKGMF
jgi:hypothetical protein